MTLKEWHKLSILYLLALINSERAKNPNINEVNNFTLDKKQEEMEKEFEKLTGVAISLSLIYSKYNGDIKKAERQVLNYLNVKKQVLITEINQVLAIPNKNIAKNRINTLTRKLKKEGIAKIPVLVNGKIQQWNVDAYLNREYTNSRYDAIRESSKQFATANEIDIYKVVHMVTEISRPLCLPYNDKYISYTLNSGIYKGLNVININDTSYGQAAGLFGVNCRHVPMPILSTTTDIDLSNTDSDIYF